MSELPVRGCRNGADPGQEGFECVLDAGEPALCLYAADVTRREQCRWWQEPELKPNRPRRRKDDRQAANSAATRAHPASVPIRRSR